MTVSTFFIISSPIFITLFIFILLIYFSYKSPGAQRTTKVPETVDSSSSCVTSSTADATNATADATNATSVTSAPSSTTSDTYTTSASNLMKISTEPFSEEEPQKSLLVVLKNTEKTIFGRIKDLFSKRDTSQIKKNLDEIEEVLYTSDLGPSTVQRLMNLLEEKSLSFVKNNLTHHFDEKVIKLLLKEEFQNIFSNIPPRRLSSVEEQNTSPLVWLIVGVNGAGKTTSIGKLASDFARKGKKVLVAAGDTFRAAAGAQLKVWTERAQVEIFSPERVSDPSALAFDAINKAKSQKYDLVLLDTAGRLHTQQNLMEELKKIKRVMGKIIPEAPHEVLMVLDANNGQNALVQAQEFHESLGLTGVILTKMDGTARGGVAIGLAHDLKIPIQYIGVGEKIGDLRTFSPSEFIDSILGND